MADAVVSLLLENINQLLIREASLLLDVKENVRSMHSWLKLIKEFLKKTARRRDHDMVRELVDQIQEAAQEAEDAIDTYVVNRLKQQRRNLLKKIFYGTDHLTNIHKVATEIENINKRIDYIYQNKEKLGIDLSENVDDSPSRAEVKRRRNEVEEVDVVGFNKYVQQLVNQLLGGTILDVHSIIGMGGLGKTTLARKVFKTSHVENHFQCRSWFYVSQEYRTRDLVLNLMKQVTTVTPKDHELDDQKLKEKLNKSLRGRRYLIVLDDIWKPQAWDEVKICFPDDKNGSKILFTSRIKEVAAYASATPPLLLPLMDDAQSWELFTKKVFRGESCPKDLEDLGWRMCRDCNGLPLAIVVLSGLLLTREKSRRSWTRIVDDVSWHLTRDPTRCLDILALSYDDLPPYLKPCFLYFGVYPEDFEIPAKQIMQLWLAEGFVQYENKLKMEDLAEEYLEELAARSLIQVASKGRDGRVKTCRIHDLLRDLCIVEGAREKFFEVFTNSESKSSNKPRRISIHSGTPRYITSTVREFSCTRSFLCFDFDSNLATFHWKSLCKSFKLIRVLDLVCTNVQSVPTKLDGLVYLRYLRLSDPIENASPPAMSSLLNLQTLHMRGRKWKTIPDGFWKMRQLRHFYVSSLHIFGLPLYRSLENLQTLTLVRADANLKDLIRAGKFPMLTMLGLDCSYCSDEVSFLETLHHLKCLKSLKICHATIGLPHNLEHFFPLTLAKINLKYVRFEKGGLGKLKKLPNLLVKTKNMY